MKVEYKGYRICDGWSHVYRYSFVHEDYDGAPDANDHRCGGGTTIEDCKKQIDEIEYETDEKECLRLLKKSYPDNKLNDAYDFSSHVFSANDMIDFAIKFKNSL